MEHLKKTHQTCGRYFRERKVLSSLLHCGCWYWSIQCVQQWLQAVLTDKHSIVYVARVQGYWVLWSLSIPCFTTPFNISSAFLCFSMFLSETLIENRIFAIRASICLWDSVKGNHNFLRAVFDKRSYLFLIQVPYACTHLWYPSEGAVWFFVIRINFPISEVVWFDKWV